MANKHICGVAGLLPEEVVVKPHNVWGTVIEWKPLPEDENKEWFKPSTVTAGHWDYLCRLARAKFTQAEKVSYLNKLRDLLVKKLNLKNVSDFDLLQADPAWQAEIICIVKNIAV